MQVSRETILEMIRMRGDGAEDAAREAEEALPEQFDAREYAGELEKLGIRPEDLDAPGLTDPGAPTT